MLLALSFSRVTSETLHDDKRLTSKIPSFIIFCPGIQRQLSTRLADDPRMGSVTGTGNDEIIASISLVAAAV